MPETPGDRVSAKQLVALVCAAQVLVQLGAFFWPALLPGMIARWGLTYSEAGWITAAFYAAYIAAVPVLVTLTDRVDAKLVYLSGVAMTVVGHALGGTTTLDRAEKNEDNLKKALMVDALPFLGGMQNPQATADSVRPEAETLRDAMLASKGQMSADQLEPQMAYMSKDKATRHMVAEWGVVSDRTVVARAMFEDTLLDLRPGLSGIKTPMTLVYPDNIPLYVPADDGKGLSARLRAATAEAGRWLIVHFVMLDQPDAFNAASTPSWRKIPAGPGGLTSIDLPQVGVDLQRRRRPSGRHAA